MKLNFKNRVRNFKFSPNDVFVPLYEAITNSIQAIEEKNNLKDSYINVKIARDSYRIGDFISGIFSIEIADNGIGFVNRNYESFCTSDSDYKFELGGKGVGRINWLKAYEITHIKSVYEEHGKKYARLFSFNIEDEIHNEELYEVESDVTCETRILLQNLNPDYRSLTELSLKEIASKIIEHFATYFVIGAMPHMMLADEQEVIDLNDFFEKEKFIQTFTETVTTNNSSFNIRHVFLNASVNARHKIYICAQNRVVCSYDINNIKNLPSTFLIDNKKAIYQCYVSGEFLDSDVNSERTYFSNVVFEDSDLLNAPHFELAINLYEIVYERIKSFLNGYLQPMIEIRNDQIASYIRNYCPEYKYLIKYASEELKNISYSIASNPEKLAVELSKLALKVNQKNKTQVNKTLQEVSLNVKDKLLNLVSPLSENLKSEFATYVQKRNAALDVLERLLALHPSTEDVVNKFFINEATTNESTSFDTNLWLLDERLSFNYDLIKTDNKNLFVYKNDFDKTIIMVYFEDIDKVSYDQTNNPTVKVNEEMALIQTKGYNTTKYLVVRDAQVLKELGLIEKGVHVFDYNKLIERAKNKNYQLLKTNK